MSNIKAPKKLIEVALPLDDINAAAAREKSIRHGHPSTLHLWWARRPLAAARAVLFAQMVNDPGGERGWTSTKTKEQAAKEREELFDIIRDLVKWENTTNEDVLERARKAIRKSWRETCELNKGKPGFDPDKLPAFHDPFAGGGAIPLEAQRLGLESYASDLNPVAVMINKAMIEIPPKFAGRPPVGPLPPGETNLDLKETWPGATGLAEDVRRYGHWMREEAFKRIGHLYPKVKITEDMAIDRDDLKPYVGKKLTVIAWLWARTVKSPNPAFSHLDVPLVSSFVLSSKKGKEAWVEPVVNGDQYDFIIRTGPFPKEAKNGTKSGRGANFNCLLSNTPINSKYIYAESQAGNLNQKLMAIVAEGKKRRVYIPASPKMINSAQKVKPEWAPTTLMPENPRWFSPPMYGMKSYGDLFTSRQLVALTTFADLVQEARNKAIEDAKAQGLSDDGRGIDAGGTGAKAYGDAVATYLGMAVSRTTNTLNALAVWSKGREQTVNLFSRQAIPMCWDFPEVNPFAGAAGDFALTTKSMNKVILKSPVFEFGKTIQKDAQTQNISTDKVISTDPPYYDNIGYADLSDFFYVWIRRSLRNIYPNLFSTMAVPKNEELIASPYRHGSKNAAEVFFIYGMTKAIHNMAERAHPAFPVSIYYAFKQSETKNKKTSNTGWETFLEAIINAGLVINGTWPMRTERPTGVKVTVNALASSIVLVCKKREKNAQSIFRRQFQRELRETMPEALEAMIGGSEGASPIAPVDLAQSAIGPGMAIYSKYEAVLNQDGSKMSVHDALIMINRAITDHLHPDSGNFDADTLFCDDWFDQYGWKEGPFGEANVLAQAKGTTVDGVAVSGAVTSGGGKVRLLKWSEYPEDWDPKKDKRTPVWEACHQLIRELNQKGEAETGRLLSRMADKGEAIRQLAYHLYTLCERKKWAEDARAYNELISSWHAIVDAAGRVDQGGEQLEFDF